MTHDVKKKISRQLTIRTAPFRILSNLRVKFTDLIPTISGSAAIDSTISNSANFNLFFFAAFIDFMFKPRDIYNMQAQLRRDRLEAYNFVQALMHQFDRQD